MPISLSFFQHLGPVGLRADPRLLPNVLYEYICACRTLLGLKIQNSAGLVFSNYRESPLPCSLSSQVRELIIQATCGFGSQAANLEAWAICNGAQILEPKSCYL
jgi:hypothetical protein